VPDGRNKFFIHYAYHEIRHEAGGHPALISAKSPEQRDIGLTGEADAVASLSLSLSKSEIFYANSRSRWPHPPVRAEQGIEA